MGKNSHLPEWEGYKKNKIADEEGGDGSGSEGSGDLTLKPQPSMEKDSHNKSEDYKKLTIEPCRRARDIFEQFGCILVGEEITAKGRKYLYLKDEFRHSVTDSEKLIIFVDGYSVSLNKLEEELSFLEINNFPRGM